MIAIDHLLRSKLSCPAFHPERRRWLLAGLGVAGGSLLGGCVSPSMQLMGASFAAGPKSDSGYPLSQAQIAAIPYASLGVQIGDSAPLVMILASVDGRNQHWASADRVVLITEAGRLVKTIGLPRDLVGTRWTGADTVLPALRGDAGSDIARVGRIIDLRPDDDFSVPVESRCERIGEQSLTVLGRERRAVLVRERMVVHKWRWKAENRYWFDAETGRMLKSRQQYCPEVPPITLQVLKPAAEPALPSA